MPALNEFLAASPGIGVVWRAFELRPEPVPMLDPAGEYITRAWEGSVLPLAKELGVTIARPAVQPRTRLAHEAAKWAEKEGGATRLHDEIFRAFFERGEDIGEAAVLVALAERLGLRHAILRDALDRRWFQQDVLDDERVAAELGVHGVPAFVIDRRAGVSGVQRVETLQRLVGHVRAQTKS